MLRVLLRMNWLLLILIVSLVSVQSFSTIPQLHQSFSCEKSLSSSLTLRHLLTEKNQKASAEDTAEQYGLEFGLAQAAKEGDRESAKSLLKKYGIAYLATSIPLAIISFAFFYVLVDNGVDVSAILAKVGIENSGTADKAGTVAIAYAAHKAASPIRFPPTVLLTPIVAKLIGKEPESTTEE